MNGSIGYAGHADRESRIHEDQHMSDNTSYTANRTLQLRSLAMQITRGQTVLTIVKDDITKQHVDAVINAANAEGIAAIVKQQFEVGMQVLSHGLVPMLEPEYSIKSEGRAEGEKILKDEIL